MPELPVVDEEERERIRQALKRYKKAHKAGDPELRQRIINVLGFGEVSMPLSTLQRFLRGTHRTDDIAVWRYAKFLSIVSPPSLADKIGAALSSKMLYPVNLKPKPAVEYEGRYEASLQRLRGKQKDSDSNAREWGCVMLPARDPSFLSVWAFSVKRNGDDPSAEPEMEYAQGSGLFVPCGIQQYLLMNVAFANMWCSLVSEVNDDPVTFQGMLLQTTTPGQESESAYELRLTQVDGPNFKRRA